eukprot:3366605-Amphidinium_carterae.1
MVRLVKCKFHAGSELQGSAKIENHHDMLLSWRRALWALSCFGLCVNCVVGVLPRSGVVQVINEVQNLVAKENSFAGALPDGGMRAMRAVTTFSIGVNSFTGMLPESGLTE